MYNIWILVQTWQRKIQRFYSYYTLIKNRKIYFELNNDCHDCFPKKNNICVSTDKQISVF